MAITLDGTTGITASGNITGNYIFGNGSQLSGIDATGIQNGTSNVKVVSSGGNATINIGGSSNIAVFSTAGANITGTLDATGNITGGNLSGTNIVGTLTTAAQTNITSVGTLGTLNVTGNANVGNLGTAGLVVATGNVTGGNLTTAGLLSVTGNANVGNLSATNIVGTLGTASQTNITAVGTLGTLNVTGNANVGNLGTNGNITASYLFGNGSQLSGIDATSIQFGTSNVKVVSSGGNVATSVGGTADVLVVTATGANIAGTVNATGNANVGNLGATNIVGTLTTAAQTNITSVGTLGTLNVTGNANVGNLGTTGIITATGGISTGGVVTATGNVTGGNVTTSGIVTATGNITGGNVTTSGIVTATGNITGGNVSGTLLTGTLTTAAQPNVTSVGTLTSLSVTGNIDGGNVSGTLLTGTLTTAAQPNVTSVGTLSSLSVTGNIGGGNVSGTLLTGTLTTAAQPNVTSLGTLTSLTITGNINQTGNLNVTGNINATGNLNYQEVTDLVVGDPLIYLGANNVADLDDLGFVANWDDGLYQHGGFVRNHLNGVWGVFGNVVAEPTTVIDWGNAIYQPFRSGSATFAGANINGALTGATTGAFSGNVSTGNVSGATGTFTNVGGTMTTASQTNITSVGTLGSLSVTGNISGGNVSGTLLTGTLATAAQPNVTSVGTLTSLSVTGNVSGGNLVTAGTVFAPAMVANSSTYDTRVSLNSAAGIVEIISNGNATQFTPSGQINLSGVSTIAGGTFTGSGITLGTSQTDLFQNRGGNVTVQVGTGGAIANTWTFAQNGSFSSPGNVTASGNVSGTYLLGNGTFITGLSASKIFNGTSEANIGTSGGNANITIGGVSNVAVFTTTGANIAGTLNATGNANVGNLGATNIVGTLTTAAQTNITSVGTLTSLAVTGNISGGNLSGTNIVGTLTTAAQTNITSVGTLTSLAVTGNVSGGNLLTSGNIVDTGALSIITAASGNINLAPNGTNVLVTTTTGANITGTLNVTSDVTFGGNLIDTGALDISTGSNGNITLSPNGSGLIVANKDIRNGQANGVGNIGAVGAFFNTIFAKATSAQYADLAEMYVADLEYSPATVLSFGGEYEVTLGSVNDSRVAGVVSTNPSYIMNSGLEGEHVVAVALTGRVPCRVLGTVRKGDMMVSAGNGYARAEDNPRIGTVIGKALEDFDGDSGTIEVVVGRM